MSDSPVLKVQINVDGGSRGNPGPAGAGVVIREQNGGRVLHEAGLFLGRATNNVAEYRALLAGLEKALELGVRDALVLSDSELLVRQMTGIYRVKNEHLLRLFEDAKLLEGKFRECRFRHIRREENTRADELANEAMDLRKNVEKTGALSKGSASKAQPPAGPHAICCQWDIVWEDKQANFDKVSAMLYGQVAEGSLIILPEMFATGFSMNLEATLPRAGNDAEEFLAELAKQHKSFILGGVTGRGAHGRGSNQAVGFDPAGKEVVRYTKMYPFSGEGEAEVYPAGRKIALFEWNGLKIAPLVCYDLRFPELFRDALRHGAQAFAAITNWPVDRQKHWLCLLQARAIENQAYVIGVNRCGRSPHHVYAGGSSVFNPHGDLIAQAGPEECVLHASLNVQEVLDWRKSFPAVNDYLNKPDAGE